MNSKQFKTMPIAAQTLFASKVFKCFTAAAIFSLSVSCSEKKQLTEMHDATVSMDRRTEVLNQKTNLLKEDSHQLLNLSAELYDALRQGDTLKIRNSSWEAALKAERLEEKLAQSALYFMSYEFQLWNSSGQDVTVEKRESLMQQATMEFMLKIEGIAPRENEVNPLATPLKFDIANFGEVTGDFNRTATFNAMSAVIHKMNRKELENLKQMTEKYQALSMLDLIEKSLLLKKMTDQESLPDSVMPEYAREVLAHEDVAIQLMQTRISFLSTMWLMKASGLQSKGMLKQFFGVYVDNFTNAEWTFDISKMNATQLNYYRTEVLEQAIRTQKFLAKIGVPEIRNTQIQLMHGRMKIINFEKTTNEAQKIEQQKFVSALQQLFGY